MNIHPLRHSPVFDLQEQELAELAGLLVRTIGRLEGGFPEPDYNLVLHTAPANGDHGHYHWHLELLPRLTITAGFEWGTGVFINPTAPENAAHELRAMSVE
jgi:UDPglucose--hexose-1-phosphate uridylyltransferase